MPELPGNLTESAAQKGMSLPIQEVWLNAVKGKDGYVFSGTVNTTTSSLIPGVLPRGRSNTWVTTDWFGASISSARLPRPG